MRLLIASADGYVYIYAVNPAEGGDCTLLKQHRLDGKAENGSAENPQSSEGPAHISTVKAKSDPSTESEKFHEMVTATEAPPVNQLRLDDDGEFPPMVQKLD